MAMEALAIWSIRLVGLLVTIPTLQLLGLVIYRLYFHPLAKYPGPFWAKVTDLYAAYHSFYGQQHLRAYEAHEKYGPIVRMGPGKLSMNSVAALQDIYNSKQTQKSKGYAAMAPVPGAFNTHSAIDKDLHRRKRRVFGQAFTEQAVRDFEPIMVRQVNIFLDQLLRSISSSTSTSLSSVEGSNSSSGYNNGSSGSRDRRWSAPVDMSPRCRRLAADIMGEFGFGRSFDTQTSERNRFLLAATQGASLVAGVYQQYPLLKDYGVGRLVKYTGSVTRERYGALVKEMVQKRLAEKEDGEKPSGGENNKETKNKDENMKKKKDLLSFIGAATDPDSGEKRFSTDEVWAEGRVIVMAGTDTTSTALAATLFYLSRYPACHGRLAAAVRSAFREPADIRLGPALASCHYLRACIDEAMRMSPPVGAALWREVCEGGAVVDGHYVPAGVDVGSALYCVHHDETVFPRSFEYRPERWLSHATASSSFDKKGSSENIIKGNKSGDGAGIVEENAVQNDHYQKSLAFNPFSLGSRKCVAHRIASAELQLALAKIVWWFDFRRPQQYEEQQQRNKQDDKGNGYGSDRTAAALDAVGAGSRDAAPGRRNPLEFQLEEHLTSIHDGPYLEWAVREDMLEKVPAVGEIDKF